MALQIFGGGSKSVGSSLSGTTSIMMGADYWAAGNSYTVGTGASNNYGHNSRVKDTLRLTSRGTVIAQGGTYMIDLGLWTSCHLSGGWGTGLVSMNGVINDVNGDGASPAKNRLGFQNGLTLFIANARAACIWGAVSNASFYGSPKDVGNGAFAVTYTGSWGTDFSPPKTSGNFVPSDALKQTTTQGAYADIVLNGKKLVIVVSGYDNASSAVLPASYSVTEVGPGTVLASGTTGNQFLKNGGPSGLGDHLPIPIRVTASTNGATVRITKTDATAAPLKIWYYLVPSESGVAGVTYKPKTVLVHKQGYLPAAGYGNGATDATVDVYNDLIDAVITSFGVPATELLAVPVTGWDKTTCVGGDNLHPNDLGHKILADNALALLNALPYRLGQNYAT